MIQSNSKEISLATAYLPNLNKVKIGPYLKCKRRKQTYTFKRAVPVQMDNSLLLGFLIQRQKSVDVASNSSLTKIRHNMPANEQSHVQIEELFTKK